MPVARPHSHGNGWTIIGRLYLVAGFIFLLLPIVTLVAFSFQKNQYASLPGQGWSLRWYIKLFSDGALHHRLLRRLCGEPLRLRRPHAALGRAGPADPHSAAHPRRRLPRPAFPPRPAGSALQRADRAYRAGDGAGDGDHPAPPVADAGVDRGGGLGSRLHRVSGPLSRRAALRAERHRRRLAARLHLLLRRVRHRLVRLRLRPDAAGRHLRLYRRLGRSLAQRHRQHHLRALRPRPLRRRAAAHSAADAATAAGRGGLTVGTKSTVAGRPGMASVATCGAERATTLPRRTT